MLSQLLAERLIAAVSRHARGQEGQARLAAGMQATLSVDQIEDFQASLDDVLLEAVGFAPDGDFDPVEDPAYYRDRLLDEVSVDDDLEMALEDYRDLLARASTLLQLAVPDNPVLQAAVRLDTAHQSVAQAETALDRTGQLVLGEASPFEGRIGQVQSVLRELADEGVTTVQSFLPVLDQELDKLLARL